jgi:hypothetical protein
MKIFTQKFGCPTYHCISNILIDLLLLRVSVLDESKRD